MLADVPKYHVPTGASDPRAPHVFGRELGRQSVVEAPQRLETLEHLGVARRVGSAAGDDVTAVLPMFARGAEELAALRQGVADGFLQVGGVVTRERVGLVTDSNDDRFLFSVDRQL